MGPHPEEDREVSIGSKCVMRFKPKRRKSTGCRSPISSYRSILPAPVTWMKSTPAMIFSDYGGKTLKSFGINPGGSVGFFYSEFGDHDTFSIRGDTVAMMRLEMKVEPKKQDAPFVTATLQNEKRD